MGLKNSPTIRNIRTAENGDITIYATATYWKDPSGITQRLIFSRFDAAELDTLFIRGTLVDASFALDSYDYQLNAIRNKIATWTVHETNEEASMLLTAVAPTD